MFVFGATLLGKYNCPISCVHKCYGEKKNHIAWENVVIKRKKKFKEYAHEGVATELIAHKCHT